MRLHEITSINEISPFHSTDSDKQTSVHRQYLHVCIVQTTDDRMQSIDEIRPRQLVRTAIPTALVTAPQ